ncbi:MAG: MoxR family ATPase [Pseudomonadota bacterium]
MSVNAQIVSAGEALETLEAGWTAQSAGHLTASWMLHGRPGVGKTQLVTELGQRIGARLFDIRLTTIEPQDLRGLPYYDHAAQKTVWYRPEDLPDDPTRPSILFLDELTAASPNLQPTVYGLLQERRVGRHLLPASVFIVAAGNTVDDGAIAYEMGTALSDRLIHLQVSADAKDWLERYAVDRGLSPMVTAFLRARPDLLDTTEQALRRGEMIACTPRAWERVSDITDAVTDKRLRHSMIAGTIGTAAAAEFAQVAAEIEALVSLQEIIDAPKAKRSQLYPHSINGLVGLIYALVAYADKVSISDVIDIMADLRNVDAPGLPLAELTTFGFEILIRKAMSDGLADAFGTSDAYQRYAKERAAAGAL